MHRRWSDRQPGTVVGATVTLYLGAASIIIIVIIIIILIFKLQTQSWNLVFQRKFWRRVWIWLCVSIFQAFSHKYCIYVRLSIFFYCTQSLVFGAVNLGSIESVPSGVWFYPVIWMLFFWELTFCRDHWPPHLFAEILKSYENFLPFNQYNDNDHEDEGGPWTYRSPCCCGRRWCTPAWGDSWPQHRWCSGLTPRRHASPGSPVEWCKILERFQFQSSKPCIGWKKCNQTFSEWWSAKTFQTRTS